MMLLAALILDAACGEPRWLWDRLPHPAVLMGRVIAGADARFNRGDARRRNGILLAAALVLGSLAIGAVLQSLGPLPAVLCAAILLAQRSLADHVAAVATALRQGVPQGRAAVAMIVGRDTAQMTAPAIARAAIESAAENLSDGVVAPAFWFAVAGLPGLIAYKAVNTADSMVGHLTPHHREFGWASARLDDVSNWIPARLTAALIAVAHAMPQAARVIARDAPLHRSPNAGWPEAAMAAVLGVALSGPRSYDGEMQAFAYVNAEGRHDIGPDDIDAAITALWRTWIALLILASLTVLV